ncbi:MAG TPA: hypothetical protein VMT24_08220 [Aggregatilineaceae bacterium]|nr:hypothetical protein [Aggregatilineaceae bacterium]
MGSGTWSTNAYEVRLNQRQSQGQDVFAYNRGARGVHPTLDPDGLEMRESRDGAEHPDSNAIIVGLDVSGSMGRVVRAIHKDLPQFFRLLMGHHYIPHPQILFAAFSNGRCDQVPLQIGQFESDNRMDINLENMVMGAPLAGGCDPQESAEIMFYIAAHHTSIDCWEKRQRKGYLFLITDEPAYTQVKKDEINRIISPVLHDDIPLENAIAEAAEHYHLYVVTPAGANGAVNQSMLEFWKSYVGPDHVVVLKNPDDISEIMALTIGLTEHAIRLEDGLQHLKTDGASQDTLEALSAALATIAEQSVKGSGLGLDDLDTGDSKRVRRL